MWIGERVAAALSYAHSFCEGEIRGVLHRDIAPGNILVDTEGGVKLADFGLARVQTDVTGSLTIERELSGTVPYLAPEVVRAERVTERSDIYGLGAVLYELAVGSPPFEGTNHYELIRKIGDGERPNARPLHELAPSFPAGFHTLVESMLALDPEDRPKSADDVQLRLQECGVGRAERRGLGKSVREVQEKLRESAPAHAVSGKSDTPTIAKRTASVAKTGKWRGRALFAVAVAALVPILSILIPSWGASKSSEPLEPPTAAATSADSSPNLSGPTTNPTATAPWSVPEELALAEPDEVPLPLSRGRLVVYAEPWGNVWINGKQVGRSPFRERLKPGLYTVQVGDTYPEEPQRIRVSSGKTREVLIRRAALQ
jgi:serine/threonine protein kinase